MDQTQIVNTALTFLGQKSIAIITENKPVAIRCRDMWDSAWETFLESHDWKFARKTAALALNTAEPAIDYRYSYTMPSDCLVPRVLVDSDMPFTIAKGGAPVEYDVVGTKLWTDCENAYLFYTHRVTDHNLATPAVVRAFACSFAIDLAIGMTGSKAVSKIRDQLKEDLPLFMMEAIRTNDGRGYKKEVEKDYPTMNPYLAARQ
jgi:hypothetical protein